MDAGAVMRPARRQGVGPSARWRGCSGSYLLEGRYLAETLIAQGDTANVFSGTDTWSGEHVAIRILRFDRTDRAAAFRRMSERLFGTASTRLLRAFSMGDAKDGLSFLVTELLLGRDLERLGRVR